MNLREYRRSTTQLADFLPWAALVDEGIVLNKDGSFQRTARFRGPDLESAVPAELVGVAGRLNNALRRLGSGWAVFVEAQRHPASKYPDGYFPDVASALVDVERRAEFEQEGSHFESSYFLTFLYLPPAEDTARGERFLYEGRDRNKDADAREVQRGFVDRTERTHPVVFRDVEVAHDVAVIRIDPTWTVAILPESFATRGPLGSFSLRRAVDESGTLTLERFVQFEPFTHPAAEFPAFAAWLAELDAAEERQITLKKTLH